MILLNKFLYSFDKYVRRSSWLEVTKHKRINLVFLDRGDGFVTYTFATKNVHNSFDFMGERHHYNNIPIFMNFTAQLYIHEELSGIKKLEIPYPNLLNIIKNNGVYSKYEDIIVVDDDDEEDFDYIYHYGDYNDGDNFVD